MDQDDQTSVKVNEPRQHRPAARIHDLVGGGDLDLRRPTHPDDAPSLNEYGRVQEGRDYVAVQKPPAREVEFPSTSNRWARPWAAAEVLLRIVGPGETCLAPRLPSRSGTVPLSTGSRDGARTES